MSQETEYLTAATLAKRYDVGPATIWRWSANQKHPFPQPIKLGPNCTRWRIEDIEAFEARCKEVA